MENYHYKNMNNLETLDPIKKNLNQNLSKFSVRVKQEQNLTKILFFNRALPVSPKPLCICLCLL